MKMSLKTATIYLALLALTLTLSSAHAHWTATSIPKFLQRYELPSSIILTDVQRFGCNYQLTDDKVSGDDNGGIKPIPSISVKGGYNTQKMGGVQEYTAVMGASSSVTIIVKLIQAHADPAGINGKIYGEFAFGSQFTLFEQANDNAINTRQGYPIQLIQSQLSVPGNVLQMQIEANLKENDGDNINYVIAEGKAVFTVKNPNVSESKTINGKDGSIEVKVIWN
uniref:Salt-induced protein n=1 Tax=Atriplex nummularia TaxID=3553 RepID=Q7XZR3_ATRNU|nr:salt-induced protein [Atriplex nummularia]